MWGLGTTEKSNRVAKENFRGTVNLSLVTKRVVFRRETRSLFGVLLVTALIFMVAEMADVGDAPTVLADVGPASSVLDLDVDTRDNAILASAPTASVLCRYDQNQDLQIERSEAL